MPVYGRLLRQCAGRGWLQRLEFYRPLSMVGVILCVVVTHISLLRVPYFWDETYFAPAARDLFLTGKLIPTSVGAESHPPLVYVWVAIWWKLFGFSTQVARIAILAVSTFTLVGVYRLGRLLTTGAVPIVSTILTAIYPVFFVETTLIQLDMAAAGLTLWALIAHLEGRSWRSGVLFSLAVLAKETAIVAPLVVLAVEVLTTIWDRKPNTTIRSVRKLGGPLLLPALALVCWFAWLHHATGTLFGNSGYVQDNLGGALHPTRMLLAAAQHLWHLLVYMDLFLLTGAAVIICAICPHASLGRASEQSRRAWLLLAAVVAGYVGMLSVVGLVVQARYLLPVYPIVIFASVLAVSSRTKWWPALACLTAIAFVAGLFPYRNRLLFKRDDNLAYVDFAALHQAAARSLGDGHKVKVLSTWPVTGELSAPWLGYARQPLEILQVESFTQQDLIAAKQNEPDYILLYPRNACRAEFPFVRAHWWPSHYFRGAKEPTPDEVSNLINARVIYYTQSRCDWVAILKIVHTD